MRRLCLAAAFSAALALAQAPLEFEAASVKRQQPVPIDPMQPATAIAGMPVMKGGPGTPTPGRIRYSNVTLLAVIMKAYDLYADQVIGPAWLREDRFAIEAVIPEDATAEQFREMLRNLLISRFKLDVGWEERDFKVYRLGVANGGPKLKPSAVQADDEEADALYAMAVQAQAKVDSSGCPVLPPNRRAAFGRNACTTYIGWSMDEFARLALAMMIANETGANFGPRGGWAHVIDETGLAGRFDFSLQYDTTYYTFRNAPNIPEHMRESYTSRNAVSIFKAVEPQLGLTLEPTTSKLKAIIVQRAERTPSEN